jgi:FkbM family methyltransferase
MFDGYHDPELARILKLIVRPGDVCIDIGANVGAYTLVMAFAAGPEGKVIAVEPNPHVADEMRANLALNRLGNVRVVEAALTEEDGETDLFGFDADANNQMVSSLHSYEYAQKKIPVRTITGPTLLKELEITRCNVMKIDCIGAELIAIGQLRRLIEEQCPYMIVDYRVKSWTAFGNTLQDGLDLLQSLGYRIYIADDGMTIPLGDSVPDVCNLFCVPERRRADA